jgi:hypothetical protein
MKMCGQYWDFLFKSRHRNIQRHGSNMSEAWLGLTSQYPILEVKRRKVNQLSNSVSNHVTPWTRALKEFHALMEP